ncbi:GNAT family N-acetyltransferase [Paeniglutamicibacter sp. NPDC012692]|uniref:GNAT family N-acetyltransferase n=1 Tax=Paeniglutamicibacter sp. NPDC012692 TaxID=3364388 RepID=UPI0036AEF1FB
MNSQHLRPTELAWLRPWTDSMRDVAAVLAAFDHDDMAGQAGEPINSELAARRWLDAWADGPRSDAVAFAIEHEGLAVGHVSASAIDRRHDTAWISYWVTPSARGSGLASAATAGLADHCFHELGLHRLELAHRVNNPGSGRVAVNAGFIPEGIERSKLRYLDEHGKPVRFDVQTYARLRDDPVPPLTPLRIGT